MCGRLLFRGGVCIYAAPVSLHTLVTDAGLTPAECASCVSSVGTYNETSSFQASNVFDGTTGGTDGAKRWLAAKNKGDVANTYVQITLPENLEMLKNKRLVGYRLWKLFASSTYSAARTPLEWEVGGLDANGNETTIHATGANRVTWSGSSYEVTLPEMQPPYKAFRFKPKYTPMMEDQDLQAKDQKWHVGLMEVELLFDDYITTRVFDPRFGDTVAISPALEEIAPGTDVTLTATLAGETVFKRWEGVPTNAVVRVDVDADGKGTVTTMFKAGGAAVDATLFTAPVWRFHADAPRGYFTNRVEVAADGTQTEIKDFVSHGGTGVLSNRLWQLNMTVADSARKSLGIGVRTGGSSGKNQSTGVAAPGQAYTGHGNGILDLSGPIYGASADETWTIAESYEYCLGTLNGISASTSCCPTVLVVPDTLTAVHREFMDCRDKSNENLIHASALTNVVMASTNLTSIGHNAFRGSAIKALTLKTPRLTYVGYPFSDIALGGYDASNFDLRSLDTVGGFMFTGLSGVLRFPKLLKHSWRMLGDVPNSSCSIEIGMGWKPKDHAVLTGVNSGTFHPEDSRLLSSYHGDVTFGPYSNIVHITFSNCGLRSVTFQWKPFDGLDTLLKQVCQKASKTLIYASGALGWEEVVNVAEEDWTDGEKAVADEIERTLTRRQRLLGLYQDTDGARKAWLVHEPSPFDPKGTMIIIR